MKKWLLLLTLGLAGCFSEHASEITTGTTATGVKTCLQASGQTIPKGTIAERTSDGSKAVLDANGCFEFSSTSSKVAARASGSSDSVIFYSDSALFALTIPYSSGGDTIPVVPTIVVLQDAPNAEVDSVDLIVYDKVHLLSRKVQLKRADYGDSSSFSRTLWSIDNNQKVYVHFQINGTKTFASSVYTVYPGSVAFRTWSQVRTGAVPKMIHGFGTLPGPYTNYDSIKSTVHYDSILTTDSVEGIKLIASSIYGISKFEIDGVQTDSLILNKTPGVHVAKITLTDSAGYVENEEFRYLNYAGSTISGNSYCTREQKITGVTFQDTHAIFCLE